MPIPKWSGLPRAKAPLPDPHDFGADTGCLDALHAWENFGGLTLTQAWEVFSRNSLSRQEDFVWMGHVAFAYYFPVLDRHLREARPTDELDDCEAWIIGCGVEDQLMKDQRFGPGFLKEVEELAVYMRGFAEKFGLEGCENVRWVWEKVEAAVEIARKR